MSRHAETRLEQLLSRWAVLVNRRPGWVLAISVLLTLAVLPAALHLEIIWGEDTLFPSGRGDRRERAELTDRLGPTGMIVTLVEGGTPAQRRQVADEFVRRLGEIDAQREITGDAPLMRHILYKLPLGFFEPRRMLYLSEADLLDIEARLNRRLKQERLKHNPFYVDLDELQEPDVDVSFEDLQRKYAVHRFREYSTDADDTLLVLLMKPQHPSSRLDFSRNLMKTLRETARSLTEGEGRDVTLTFGGSYLEQLRDWTRLGNTTRASRTLFILGYSLVVLLLFRRLRVLLMLAFAMTCLFVWMRALAFALPYGVTLFASICLPIVFGLGAAYGLVLMYGYFSARGRNLDPDEALVHAIRGEGRIILIGALATALAGAGLTVVDVADFRVFSLLLGAGLILAPLAMLGPLMALLALWERRYLMVVSAVVHIINPLPRRLSRGRALLATGALLALFGLGALAQSALCWRMNEREGCRLEPCCEPVIALSHTVSSTLRPDPVLMEVRSKLRQVVPVTREPIFIIAPDRPTLREVVRQVEELSRTPGGLIHSVYSLVTFVPSNQDDKLEILRRIDGLATEPNIAALERATQHKIEELRPILHPPRISAYQLPVSILRAFSLQAPGSEPLIGTLSQALARLGDSFGEAEWEQAVTQHVRRLPDSELSRILGRADASGLFPAPDGNGTPATRDAREERLLEILRHTHRHHVGVVGMVYPRRDLSDGRLAMNFLDLLSPLAEAHPGVVLLGRAVDLGETLSVTRAAAGWLLIWAPLALLLVLALTIRRPLRALLVLLPLLAALLTLAAGIALTGLRWNLYGLLALPLMVGMGLDVSLRVYLNYRESRQIGSVPALLHALPGQLLMLGTLLLTLLGWLFADHAIVVSVAAVGVVGMLLCVACAWGVLAPILELLHAARLRRTASSR